MKNPTSNEVGFFTSLAPKVRAFPRGEGGPKGRMRDGVQFDRVLRLKDIQPVRLLPAFLISQKLPLESQFLTASPRGKPWALPRQ